MRTQWLLPAHRRRQRAAPVPASPDEARRRYLALSRELRELRRLLALELERSARRLEEIDHCADSYARLLLYDMFGHRSRQTEQRIAALRRRHVELAELGLLLARIDVALEAGLFDEAARLLTAAATRLDVVRRRRPARRDGDGVPAP